MTCSLVRRTLLAQESPQPADAEARHLLGCPVCRAWHRRLVRIEQQIPLVTVPACPVPVRLLDSLHSPLPISGASRVPGRHRNLEDGRKKLALAFSLAASLAVFAVGWWAWPQLPSQPNRRIAKAPDPYVQVLDERLKLATTAPRRAAVMADLADEFFAEVRQKGHDPARVAVLARWFDRLVVEDLIHQIGLVSPGKRRAVASLIAQRLGQLQSEATRLAIEWAPQHPSAVASLRRIVASARAAEDRLRQFA